MISKDQVRHIAKLARISLTKEEEEKFQKELSLILDYVGKLKEVKIEGVSPFFQSSQQNFNGEPQILVREDKVNEETPETKEKLIESAPEKEKRYLKVKPIF